MFSGDNMRLLGRHGILVKMYREAKWFFQRGIKGYCEKDLWSIDHWLATTFPKMLDEYNTVNLGYPDGFEDKMRRCILAGELSFIDENRILGGDTEDDYATWRNTVREMSRLLRGTNLENGTVTDDEAIENMEHALALLKICYFDLFW